MLEYIQFIILIYSSFFIFETPFTTIMYTTPPQSYIVAQIERFCAMYNIRGLPEEHESLFAPTDLASQDAASMAAAAAAGISLSPTGGIVGIPTFMDPHTAAAAAVAAAAATNTAAAQQQEAPSPTNAGGAAHAHAQPGGGINNSGGASGLSKKQTTEVSRAQRMAKDAEKALEQERRQNQRKEQKRLSQERKELKQREREALAQRKAAERTERESTREERRKKKLEIRQQREKFAQEQKELALKRAAESNHRSLNGEVIARLEQTLGQRQDRANEHLARAQQLRESFSPPTILKMKKMSALAFF